METDIPPGALNLPLSELENTFGVLFVGYVFAMIAFGFTFFQTYIYFSRYPTDRVAVKAVVTSVCLLDLAGSALISHALYTYLVLLFPFTKGLYNATSTYCAEMALSIVAVFIVQVYYSMRIWNISKNTVIASIIAVISMAACALGLAMVANLVKDTAFESFGHSRIKSVAGAGQALTFVSGLLTFGALNYYLGPVKIPSDSARSVQARYDAFVTYTMSRGAVAVIVQLGFFITFLIMPTKAFWMPFHLVASKLFINSLLTMLNSREIYDGRGLEEDETITRRSGPVSFAGNSSFSRSNGPVRFGGIDSKAGGEIQHLGHQHGANKFTFGDDIDSANWASNRKNDNPGHNQSNSIVRMDGAMLSEPLLVPLTPNHNQ